MGVTDDVARTVDILRSRVVCAGGVGKCTRGKVDHLNRDGEGSFGWDSVAVLGVGEDASDHLVDARNVTHRYIIR